MTKQTSLEALLIKLMPSSEPISDKDGKSGKQEKSGMHFGFETRHYSQGLSNGKNEAKVKKAIKQNAILQQLVQLIKDQEFTTDTYAQIIKKSPEKQSGLVDLHKQIFELYFADLLAPISLLIDSSQRTAERLEQAIFLTSTVNSVCKVTLRAIFADETSVDALAWLKAEKAKLKK